MKDYYAILGLDPDASPESIKLAYRRLAREAHPDRMGSAGPGEQAAASARMAELNEAYAVLSSPLQRRDYEEEWRKFQEGAATPEPASPPAVADVAMPMPVRVRTRPGADVFSSVVRQFSESLRKRLLGGHQQFPWRESKMEGFEWGLEARFWFARYFVAQRGFPTADPATAQKFTNYAQLAIEHNRGLFSKNYFLFLMTFQRISQPDQVTASCRRFIAAAGAEQAIVLYDVTSGGNLHCGPRIADKRFQKLLQLLEVKS